MPITQSQIDAVTTELTTVDGTINSINTTAGEIATEVAALQASNPTIDLSGLTAAAGKLGTDATTLATSVGNIQTALVPPTPAAS